MSAPQMTVRRANGSEAIAKIVAHCDKHELSGRAQFSVPGIRALLDHIASLEADVARLVIAARVVAFERQDKAALLELDQASEVFADRISWDDEPSGGRS